MNTITIDWKNIETVFLDLDGTLLDLHFDNHFWLEHMPKCYAEKHSITQEKASEILTQHSKSTEGSLNWYCLDYWGKLLDMDIEALKHQVADKIAVRKNVILFLDHLKNNNKRVVLLTNAHPKSLRVKFQYVELEKHFDQVISTHNIGLAKEECNFWETLALSDNYDKNSSLFIDDNFNVLDNAYNSGIKQLLTISQPDSKKPIKHSDRYIAIDDYQQLIN